MVTLKTHGQRFGIPVETGQEWHSQGLVLGLAAVADTDSVIKDTLSKSAHT